MSNLECDANKLFEAGGILLFYDCPANTEFGIDYHCWRTGENFKGIKMIPPGIHFIYYSATDKQGNVGMRNGFFHNFKLGEVLAKRWNRTSETIENYELNEDQLNAFKLSKREMDRFLGAYPFDDYKRWVALSNNINENFLQALVPENQIISSESNLLGASFKKTRDVRMQKNENERKKETDLENLKVDMSLLETPHSLSEAENRLPAMQHASHSRIRFTQIPNENFPKGSNASEITLHSIDSSYRLEQMISEQSSKLSPDLPSKPLNILCELQFAFVCFLIGHSYDAFEQWKLLITLLCNSEKAISKYPELFVQFIQCVYFQLKETPEDFFTDIVTRNNFLIVNLHNLFDNIKSCLETDSKAKDEILSKQLRMLSDKSNQFKNYLEQKFDYDFEQEPEEYAPVVCQECE
jgi:A1 cistron-splicing factor AAR2